MLFGDRKLDEISDEGLVCNMEIVLKKNEFFINIFDRNKIQLVVDQNVDVIFDKVC